MKRSLPFSVHTITGFILIPAVTIHSYLNRIAPSSSSTPINELSPSELDYSYVTHGFLTASKAWRYITWSLYASLLFAGAVHVVGGTDRIAKRMKAKRAMKETKKSGSYPLGRSRGEAKGLDAKKRKQRNAVINGAVSLAGVAWLAVGIRRMAWEDHTGTSTWMTKRVSETGRGETWNHRLRRIVLQLDTCYAAVWPYSLIK